MSQEALRGTDVEVSAIQALQQNTHTQWWESLGSVYLVLGGHKLCCGGNGVGGIMLFPLLLL